MMQQNQRRLVRAVVAIALIGAMTASGGVAGAEPTIDIGISNIADGQTVVLNITGFEPETSIIVGQCDAAIASRSEIDLILAGENCQLGNSVGQHTDGDGTYIATFTFDRFIEPFLRSETNDCAVQGACVLGATTYTPEYDSITFRSIPTLFADAGSNPTASPVAIDLEVEDNKLVPRQKDGKDNDDKVDKRTKSVSKGGLTITDVQVGVANGQATATIDFACDEPMEVTTRKAALKQKRKGQHATSRSTSHRLGVV